MTTEEMNKTAEEAAEMIRKEMRRGLSIVNDKHLDFFVNLYSRWQDEREYEDFADYEKVMKEKITELPIKSATKRPFGFKYDYQGFEIHIKIANGYLKADAKRSK